MTYYPVGEPVAMIVGSVGAFAAKRREAQRADARRKSKRFAEKASDRNRTADFPAPRPVVASMRELLGLAPASPMRQTLGLA